MSAIEQLLGRVVVENNRRVLAHDTGFPNPRPLEGVAWNEELERAWPRIRDEWDGFVASGGLLPRIEQVVDEHQGNQGPWYAGLLVSRGRPCALAVRFPRTVDALAAVPGVRSALWSVLAPGAELPEHQGPNAGMLRYHLGVRCGSDAGLRVADRVVAYTDGRGVLFDDTAPHAAWNHGGEERVTLFCELERPLPLHLRVPNRIVQSLISTDPRYRGAPERARVWDRRLNGDATQRR